MKRSIGTGFLLLFAQALAWGQSVPGREAPGPWGSLSDAGRFAAGAAGPTVTRIELPAPKAALAEDGKPASGPPIIGRSRKDALDAQAPATLDWVPMEGGSLARIAVRSSSAVGLRVGLSMGVVPEGLRLVVGSRREFDARAEVTRLGGSWIRQTYGPRDIVVWTPMTDGEEQVIEAWVPEGTDVHAFNLGVHDVSHIFVDPLPGATTKLLACHQNYSCSSNTTIQAAGKAVARMVYTVGGNTGFCSGSLLNDSRSTATPWFATANHCLATQAIAATVQLDWFYEVPCGGTTLVPAAARTLGTQLLFTDASVDFTLLRVTGSVPGGVTYLGWDATELTVGAAVFGVHHPDAASKAFSVGSIDSLPPSIVFRSPEGQTWTIAANAVAWQGGATEPGSSGSPLFSADGLFRGTLSAVPAQACGTQLYGVYNRFSLVYPRIRQFIDPAAAEPEEPNSAAATASAQPQDYSTKTLQAQINSAGDQDWFRFNFTQSGVWLVWTEAVPGAAATDTVGEIFLSDGVTSSGVRNDNAAAGTGLTVAPNFAIVVQAQAGRYYLKVTGSGSATGRYVLNSVFVPDDDHSNFFPLASTLGPNATATGAINYGGDSDKFAIDLPSSGTLTLSSSGSTDLVGDLYDGNLQRIASNDDFGGTVNFQISRSLPAGRYYLDVYGYDVRVTGPYSVRATFSGATATVNRTSFYWNPAEAGWGLHLNHQGNTLFGALYTYATDNQPMWLAAGNLVQQADGSFTGALSRFTGPPFSATPFAGAAGVDVGTMTVRFTNGASGTLSYTVNGVRVDKAIQPFIYGTAPTCTSGTGSRAGQANYQDMWWNANEPGWGLALSHQGNTLFGAMFNYNNSRRDVWLAAGSMVRQADGSFTGDLSIFGGPSFNAQPWGAVAPSSVGSMTLRFANGESGTLSYTVLGTTVTKAITRYVFGSTVPFCS